MNWDGKERRVIPHGCGQIENIATLLADSKHVTELLDKHTSHGHVWRVIIAGTVTTLIINIIIAVFLYGKLTEKVDNISVDVRDNTIMIREVADLNGRMGVLEEKVSWLEEDILSRREHE